MVSCAKALVRVKIGELVQTRMKVAAISNGSTWHEHLLLTAADRVLELVRGLFYAQRAHPTRSCLLLVMRTTVAALAASRGFHPVAVVVSTAARMLLRLLKLLRLAGHGWFVRLLQLRVVLMAGFSVTADHVAVAAGSWRLHRLPRLLKQHPAAAIACRDALLVLLLLSADRVAFMLLRPRPLQVPMLMAVET